MSRATVDVMPMILSGGGGVAKNPAAYELFAASVDKSRPVLYVPFASTPEKYVDNYANFVRNMAVLGIMSTRLADSPDYFRTADLGDLGGIYVAGGNTFRLLRDLRESGGLEKIKAFVKNGGAYIGSSAGAIIGGADIMPIIFMDSNAVMLEDTRGMDMIRGWSTIAHYGDASTEFKNNEWYASTERLAKKYDKLIALSEEAAIVIDGERVYILGAECKVFENGKPRIITDGGEL